MEAPNTLYYGDNLDILRSSIADASVDLIYLDPPFNSKRDYNVLFKEKSGEASPAQIEAFTDTWAWDRAAEATYAEDVTHLSITLMKKRLEDSFPPIRFAIHGEPADAGAAAMLAESDPYQFQWWALSLVYAMPVGGTEKKGADRGIDGVITFLDDATGKPKRCLIQVKGGHVGSPIVQQVGGTIARENAEMGMLITLHPSTGPMRREAVEAGFYHSPGWDRDYPRIQILTVEELMAGVQPQVPYGQTTFAKAGRVRRAGGQQPGLELG